MNNFMKNKQYLLWFANENIDFRLPEIRSLLSMFEIEMSFVEKPKFEEPFWLVKFNSEEDARKLTARSVSLKSCIELWGKSQKIAELHRDLRENLPENICNRYFTPENSFKIDVETYCRHFSQQEKVEKIEQFSYLPVQGPVNLKNPDLTLNYIEYYGTNANNPPLEPYTVFFGRLVATGLRQLIRTLSLKTRKFIGNTSMDPTLSLLMANQAKIRDGDVIFDPFVGTGSLLVAAAQFKSYVLGSDIDYLMLHARTRPSRIKQKVRDKDESIKANMDQYNLGDRYLDVIVNDFSRHPWRDGFKLDAILTDPPYGIREATEKIGTKKANSAVLEEHLTTHIPSKIEYGIAAIYKDLLNFSSKHLKIGGRLVCWFPVFRENYSENGLPTHPAFELVANSEQILTKLTSRRLLTYEKTAEIHEETVENGGGNAILDFREKYYEAREESRQEKRCREAKIREENRIKYGNINKKEK